MSIGLAALSAGFIGVVLGRYGIAPALGLIGIPAVAYVVVARPFNALLGFVVLGIAIPYYYTLGSQQIAVFRIEAVGALAVAFVLAARAPSRPRVSPIDLFVIGFLVTTMISLLLYGGGAKNAINPILPFAVYFGARNVERRHLWTCLWVVTIAGAAAALTVMYEGLIVGSAVFVPPEQYLWNAQANVIFRPGGVFGSPPAAVTVLSITAICGLPLIARSRGARRIFALGCVAFSVVGLVVTFTRAGYIGLVAGAIVYVLLAGSRVLSPRRFAVGGAVIAVLFAIVFLPAISSTTWFQEGVLRGGNLQARESYWALAEPLVTDSAGHLTFGHGVNSLVTNDPNGGQIGSIPASLQTAPTLTTIGPHSQYVRILLEQGVIGLALIALWLVGAPLLALRAMRALPREFQPLIAALTGATVSFVIIQSAGDSMRDPPSLAAIGFVTGLLASVGQARSLPSLRTRRDHAAEEVAVAGNGAR